MSNQMFVMGRLVRWTDRDPRTRLWTVEKVGVLCDVSLHSHALSFFALVQVDNFDGTSAFVVKRVEELLIVDATEFKRVKVNMKRRARRA